MFINESFLYDFNDSLEFPVDDSIDSITRFHQWFSNFHGYASIIVCIFGISTNIFNISVLTRKDMRTPTNILLTWLAVADILTMVPYIPFAIHFYCPNTSPFETPEKYTYNWIIYMIFVVNSAATTHTISNWLGVSLSVFRFMQMRSTSRGLLAKQRRLRHVKVITVLVYIFSIIVLIPNYLTNKIQSVQGPRNTTIYGLKDMTPRDPSTDKMALINTLLYAVVAKIVPCLLMSIFSVSLVYTIHYKNRHRMRRLVAAGKKSRAISKQTTTTRMLLVVIVLFLITELPQGILILVTAAIPQFHNNVYNLLGDLMDFIALLNNAINFVLYCSMSQQFRSRFIEMYFMRKRTHRPVEDTVTASAAINLTEHAANASKTF